MKLNLQQPIMFPKSLEQDNACNRSYDRLASTIGSSPVGSDGCMAVDALMTDEICMLSCRQAAYRTPSDGSEGSLSITAGTYLFLQLPFSPDNGDALMPLLNRFTMSLDFSSTRTRSLFVRLYKEKTFETVVQFIAPIDTKAE